MKAFDYSLVKDPQYFCDNRMEAHSDHVYYRDGNEMQTAVQDGTETSFRYSLNGLWKFHYARNYKSAVQAPPVPAPFILSLLFSLNIYCILEKIWQNCQIMICMKISFDCYYLTYHNFCQKTRISILQKMSKITI